MSDLVPSVPAETDFAPAMQLLYVPRPRQRYWLHILLFLLTVFTTLVVGSRMEYNFQHARPAFSLADDDLPFFPARWALEQPSRLLLGLPFASTLLLILMSHEMGHYLYCVYYGVNATLPFFIPAPTLIGTLGAFIRIRSPIRSRTALFDIGIAGPIAGFVVATTVLMFALPLSRVMPATAAQPDVQLGYPLIFRVVSSVLRAVGAHGGSVSMNSLYFHPTAIAAWVGMFATALNLLPGGQLDGGHIVFSIAPRAHKQISRLTILALIPMALYFWAGWLVWAILLRISGMRHPIVAEWPAVTGIRRWLAVLAVAMLVLTLAPAPFAHSSLLEVFQEFRSGR
jgi:membrane-associated protease RseP (regulator of RpoE activity)